MRVLILVFLTLSTLWAVDENNESYVGTSYNLNLAFELSCLNFVGATDVVNEHFGLLGRVSYCDHYTDDAQNYRKSSLILGGGVALYSHSIYRDSFFLTLTAGFDRTFIHEVSNDITGTQMLFSSVVGTGYQWQFQKGYIFSLAMYYVYRRPLSYDTTTDTGLNEQLSSTSHKFTPTFLLGWRF